MPYAKRFELSFWGTPWRTSYASSKPRLNSRYRRLAIRWRRWHPTFESAQEAALKALEATEDRAAHPAIIYGPGLGKDGRTLT